MVKRIPQPAMAPEGANEMDIRLLIIQIRENAWMAQ